MSLLDARLEAPSGCVHKISKLSFFIIDCFIPSEYFILVENCLLFMCVNVDVYITLYILQRPVIVNRLCPNK